jgi:hypothetical protein
VGLRERPPRLRTPALLHERRRDLAGAVERFRALRSPQPEGQYALPRHSSRISARRSSLSSTS